MLDPVFADAMHSALTLKPAGISNARWFALLATIYYCKHKIMPGEAIGLGNLRVLLEGSAWGFLRASHIDTAWSCLKNIGMFKEK